MTVKSSDFTITGARTYGEGLVLIHVTVNGTKRRLLVSHRDLENLPSKAEKQAYVAHIMRVGKPLREDKFVEPTDPGVKVDILGTVAA